MLRFKFTTSKLITLSNYTAIRRISTAMRIITNRTTRLMTSHLSSSSQHTIITRKASSISNELLFFESNNNNMNSNNMIPPRHKPLPTNLNINNHVINNRNNNHDNHSNSSNRNQSDNMHSDSIHHGQMLNNHCAHWKSNLDPTRTNFSDGNHMRIGPVNENHNHTQTHSYYSEQQQHLINNNNQEFPSSKDNHFNDDSIPNTSSSQHYPHLNDNHNDDINDVNFSSTSLMNKINNNNNISKKTYYRRELPSSLISFISSQGKKLFKESLVSGHAEAYFSLSGNFTHQSEPEFCGLGSLVMALNALEVDPKRTWKGVWRWYSEDMLECCSPLDQIRKQGIHFDEFVCLAKCNGLQVVAKRGDQVSKEEFIDDIQSVTSGKQDQHMVVSFSRKTLGQTGDGHFSPIGAYHVEQNKVLVLDTARFKYPSYFCSVDLLYDALKPIDKVTGLSRGYTLLKRLSHQSLSKINFDRMNWTEFAHVLGFVIPQKLAYVIHPNSSIEKVVETILEILPSTHDQSIMMHMNRPGLDLAGGKEQQDELASQVQKEASKLLSQIEAHPLNDVVKNVFLNSPAIRHHLARKPLRSILGIDVQGFSQLNNNHLSTLNGDNRYDDADDSSRSIRVHMALTTVFLLSAPERMFCTLATPIQFKLFSMINWKGDWRGAKDFRLLHQEVKHLKDQVNCIMQTYCQCSRN